MIRRKRRAKTSWDNHKYVSIIKEYWSAPHRRALLKYTPTITVNEKTGEIESDMINDFTMFRRKENRDRPREFNRSS